MTILYFAVGIILSLLIGLLAVRYEKRQSTDVLAAHKLPYLKFVRFISSWKVFFALFIPAIALDYLFFEGRAEFFFWFLVLYGAFIIPFSFSYYLPPYVPALDIFHAAGKRRHAAYASGDPQKIKDQRKRDELRYILILGAIAFGFLYWFLSE